jgi:hypothetical protein
MVFSKRLAGAIAVASVMAFSPAAGATEVTPGTGTGTPVVTQGNVGPSYAACLYWRNAARFANDEYWLASEFPDDWPFPGDEEAPGHDGHDDDFSAAYAAYQYAVQQYERLGCRALLGPPPEWGRRQ